MSSSAIYPDDDSGKVTIHAEVPPRGRRLTARCHEHGERLTPLEDAADLTIDRGGMTYRLKEPEATVIAYCQECFAVLRRRDPTLADAPARDLVEKRMTENFYGNRATGTGGFRELFDPASVTVGDGLEYCPFCGESLPKRNQQTGRVTCETHGQLRIQVAQEDV